VRAAAVQLNSKEDKQRNLEKVDRLTRAAAADGADFVLLPEKWTALGEPDDYRRAAEQLDAGGPAIDWARSTARELNIDLVAGSISERRDGHDKLGNTSIHFGPDGEIKAVYRKIHMFDVVVGGLEYRESEAEDPGEEIVLSETRDGVPFGMTVCYDLRFPELYRIQAIRGARILLVPAAFTKITGQAHWEILLRARAIENQAFVIAADQVGQHPPDKESFGSTMIVDPWGELLARAPDEETFIAADLDLARQDEVRDQLPSLANRMPATYAWPQEVSA
jgi:deaminated glutathione amidase